MIKRIPISILGVALALGTIGKTAGMLIAPVVSDIAYITGVIILLLVVVKTLLYKELILKEATSDIFIPLLTLIPMSIVALNAYFIKYSEIATTIVWYACLILIIVFTLYFIKAIIITKKFDMLLPTATVNIVGIDILIVNKTPLIGDALTTTILYYSIIGYIVTVIAVTYCMSKFHKLNDITKPTLAIYAAPPALITVASIGIITNEPYYFILLVVNVIGLIIYLYSIKITNFKKFVPTFGAFTFPIVICSVALLKLNVILDLGITSITKIIYYFAIFIVLGIIIRYIQHITKKEVQ